jgi:hypothetical protein
MPANVLRGCHGNADSTGARRMSVNNDTYANRSPLLSVLAPDGRPLIGRER